MNQIPSELSEVFNLVFLVFVLIFVFSLLFLIIVILVVWKLLRTNVNSSRIKHPRKSNYLNQESISRRSYSEISGEDKVTQQAVVFYCPFCGTTLSDISGYCPQCGENLNPR